MTPWAAARQALLSFTISWSLLKLMSIELLLLSSYFILCRPLLLLLLIFPTIGVFSNESALNKQERERERESPLAPLFICFFIPPGSALCKLGLVRSAVLPDVLTPVLGPSFDLPLFYFLGLFPSLSFNHHHFGLMCSILTT